VGASGARAGLQGQTVNVDRVIPSVPFDWNVYSGQTGDLVAGVSGPYSLSTADNDFITVGDDTITYLFGPAGGSGGQISDHVITFSETALDIAGLSVSTDLPTLSGYELSDFTFDAHEVVLNIGNFNYSAGDNTIVVTLSFANAVPELSTWALTLCGFAAVGVMLRRRSPAAVA
jgi:hypothetical protein